MSIIELEDHVLSYYFLGAVWKGHHPEDQAPRFIKDGIWENGYDDKFIDIVNAVRVGARVAIKSKFTNGIGHKNSVTRIKAIGTVLENLHNGKTLKIEWDSNFEEFDFDGGGYLKTISIVRNKEYISKAFFHGQQYVESRVARLAWNTKSWVRPSGPKGKSKYPESHEAQYGYGHEEWLLDTGKLINGYHYGFLEPIRKQQTAFSNKTYNVWLYSINEESKIRYWVGKIKNLKVLDESEAKSAYGFYKKQGWLREMREQINSISFVGADKFSKDKNIDVFNVKFRPTDLTFNDPLVELPSNHSIAGQSRYVFANFHDDFIIDKATNKFLFFEPLNLNKNAEQIQTKKYKREAKSIEITYLHKAISKGLVRLLRRDYGDNNVTPEHPDCAGGRVDVVLRDNNELVFYEIKTYNSIKASIREAIGQLMEYALWPDVQRAKELIIITPPLGNLDDTKIYLKHIRKTYQLPIYYQSYDHECDTLSEKY